LSELHSCVSSELLLDVGLTGMFWLPGSILKWQSGNVYHW